MVEFDCLLTIVLVLLIRTATMVVGFGLPVIRLQTWVCNDLLLVAYEVGCPACLHVQAGILFQWP